MSVATEHKHEAEFINIRCVSIPCLRFSVTLEICLPRTSCSCEVGLNRRIILYMLPTFHLLVVNVKTFIRILNDERVEHRD